MILQDPPVLDIPKKEHFVPFGNNVLARIVKGGGTILKPESHRDAQPRVIVLAVGPGRVTDKGERIPIACKPLDVVMVGGPITPEGMMAAMVDIEIPGEKDLVLFDAKFLMGKFEDG